MLEHLCRSADRYGLAISGDIMPGDRTEQTSERLARWYQRHGFTITQKSPGGTCGRRYGESLKWGTRDRGDNEISPAPLQLMALHPRSSTEWSCAWAGFMSKD